MADNVLLCDELERGASAVSTAASRQTSSGTSTSVVQDPRAQFSNRASTSVALDPGGQSSSSATEPVLLDPGDQFLPSAPPADAASSDDESFPNIPMLAWQPLTLGRLPGIDTILGTIKPPIQIIASLLDVVAGMLNLLQAILVDLLDPYRALLLAAYQLLDNLVKDILATGACLYADMPGITSLPVTDAEMGIAPGPKEVFHAGMTDGAPPVPSPDQFARFAQRFMDSFDDPGDDNRPVVTKGATMAAIFIVAAAPSQDALLDALYLLGQLFNIQAFVDAWKRYKKREYKKPDKTAGGLSVAPDWGSYKLKDIKELKFLEELPETFRGLLFQADGIVKLLQDIGEAIQDKVAQMNKLIAALQAVIDFLDKLKVQGLHVLPVVTFGGVEDLHARFLAAPDRPPGGYMGGVCFLAAGSSVKDMAILWKLLTSDAALDQVGAALEDTKKNAEDAWKQSGVAEKWQNSKKSVKDAVNDMIEAVENAPDQFVDDIGRNIHDIADAARNAPADLLEWTENTANEAVKTGTEQARQALDTSDGRGPRSLAVGLGADPAVAGGAPLPEEKP